MSFQSFSLREKTSKVHIIRRLNEITNGASLDGSIQDRSDRPCSKSFSALDRCGTKPFSGLEGSDRGRIKVLGIILRRDGSRD